MAQVHIMSIASI